MICERCGQEHDGSYGSGRFCSRQCANSRDWSDEHKQNLSTKLRKNPIRTCLYCGKELPRTSTQTSGLCSVCEKDARRGTGKYGVGTEDWREYTKERRQRIKQEYVSSFGGKCIKCGYDKYSGALEFHHKDPTEKEADLSKNLFARSRDVIQRELDKCVLLCCRCHRELHEEIRQGHTLEEFLDQDNT